MNEYNFIYMDSGVHCLLILFLVVGNMEKVIINNSEDRIRDRISKQNKVMFSMCCEKAKTAKWTLSRIAVKFTKLLNANKC